MIAHKHWMPLVVLGGILSLTGGATAQAKKTPVESPDRKELFAYVLTVDNLHKLGGAIKDLHELQKTEPDLFNQDDSKSSLDQATQTIAKAPRAVAIVRKNGLAPREYVVGSLTLFQGAMAVGLKKAGTIKEYPPKMLQSVSPANLTFIEQHYDDIAKLMAAFGGDDKK